MKFDIVQSKNVLTITGLYISLNSEATVNELIARWRVSTGMDDPAPETFIERVIRRWKGLPVKTRGVIECTVELDKDQRVYTAHFH